MTTTKHFYLALALVLVAPLLKAQTLSGSQNALNFNGSGDDVTITNHASINPRNEITVEAWIKPENFGKNIYDNSIFCKHGWASGNAGYVLRCGNNGAVSFNVAGRTSGQWEEAQSSTGVLKTNQWYHIAGTFDGDTVSVYVNGVLKGTHLYSGQINISSIAAKIGELAYGTGRNFDGDIDEVRLWSQALAVDTLRDWMCRRVSKQHPNFKSLEGYWDLNEGSGGSLKDISSNSNNGKFNGPKWVRSGAAVGDTSVHSYSGAKTLSLTSSEKDVFTIKNISGSHESIHLYQLNGETGVDSVAGSVAWLDSTHQWGVYISHPNSSSYDVNFDYSNFTLAKGVSECAMDFFKRNVLTTKFWSLANPTVYATADSLTLKGEKGGEYVFGRYGEGRSLSTNTGDSVFCNNQSLTLRAPGNKSFRYQWYKDGKKLTNDTLQTLRVTTGGKYKAFIRRSAKCQYTSNEMNVSTTSIPTVTLASLTGVCESVDSIFLTGGLPKGGIYKGKGVKQDSVFYPNTVKDGKYKIIYSYTGRGGCSNSDTQTIEVFDLPKISVKNNIRACDDKDTVHMIGGTPKKGTYSGKGIYNNIFYLDSVNRKQGNYGYTYSYTDANGCSNEATGTINVLFATPITFNAIDTSCSNDQPFKIKVNPFQGTYTGKGVNGRNFHPAIAGVGSHTINFEFKNINGCITSASQTAVVVGYTPTSFTGKDSICVNGDSLVLNKATPAGGTYVGTEVSNGLFWPVVAGESSIEYMYTDANGCMDTAVGAVKVLDTTVLSISPITPVCANADVFDLTNASPMGGTYVGKGVSNNQFDPKAAGPGVQLIEYEFTNSGGCKNSANFNLEVFELKDLTVDFDDAYCNNEDSFEVKSIKPKGGTLSGSGIRNGYFVPSDLSKGTYTVYYSFTDGNNCNAIDSDLVEIKEAPVAALSQAGPYCDNDDEFTLTGGTPAGGSYFIDGTLTSAFNPQNSGAGDYGLKYVVTNAEGCSDSIEQSLRVNEAPAKPTVSQSGDILTSSADDNNQWYDDNGEISGATNKTYEPSESGNFYVVVTNSDNCSASSDVFTFIHSAIDDFEANGISIYPVPAQSVLNISATTGSEIEQASLLDLNGREIRRELVSGSQSQFNLEGLTPGIYMLEIQLFDQSTLRTKIIVK